MKNLILWLIISVILIFTFNTTNNSLFNKKIIEYSKFISDINKNKIKETYINGNEINVIKKNKDNYITYIPGYDSKLIDTLLENNIKTYSFPSKKTNIFISSLISWSPLLIFITIWIFIFRFYQNGKNTFSFGKSKARLFLKNKNDITFADVAGCDEAKNEVSELTEYLKDPKRFQALGGKIPKGVLMIGPPGSGKTLLAKAIAGEAKVSFFSISGSDFVEMFVGIGASRVRDMFNKAKKNSPCIIFIDEIDAVGRKRSINLNSSHDEREQTLNQMLVEMDGFDLNNGIIVIAATNRPDVLDPALLRPGRFDRQVIIDLPDIIGREQILKIHSRKVPLFPDVDFSIIAKSTPGFSGADLANLINESALLAAKNKKNAVSMNDLEISKDKIILGLERRSMFITKKQKEYTAYHEAGHVIVSRFVPEHDSIHKVTIIPRGKSLGSTFFLPKENLINISKRKLDSQISTLYGGRIAEELIYGSDNISTGASNDIKVATSLARKMVTEWGFSNVLGPLLYSNNENELLINNSLDFKKKISDKTLYVIDKEIKFIIEYNYVRAKKILKENIDILHLLKDMLIKYETINFKQIDHLINKFKKNNFFNHLNNKTKILL